MCVNREREGEGDEERKRKRKRKRERERERERENRAWISVEVLKSLYVCMYLICLMYYYYLHFRVVLSSVLGGLCGTVIFPRGTA